MKAATERPTDDGAGAAPAITVIGIAAEPVTRRLISRALAAQGLGLATHMERWEAALGLEVDPSTIIVLACDVDAPRQLASLRRLHRELQQTPVVVISPPTTGPGVRRALDAGAHALVFEPEVEIALAPTVRAVASGQTVVPRKLRAGIERPSLSHRERQVLTLVRIGLTNAEIARRLFLAESTIKSHLSSIFTKFGVRSRKEAAAVSIDLETSEAIGAAAAGSAEQATT
jgi:DNA-binding NarL/FixJ family response regulator